MKTLMLMLVLSILIAPAAGAEVLWDQYTPDPSLQGFANTVGGAGPWGINVYAVDDIKVYDVWNLETFTMQYMGIDPTWYAGIFQATLSLFPKTGPIPGPGDDPATQIIVPATATSEVIDGNVITTMIASDLNIMIEPGEYWIGLTTDAVMGGFDWHGWRMSATPWGDAAAIYDANFGGPWISTTDGYGVTMDGCFKLEGTLLAVPTDGKSVGSLKSSFEN